MRNLKRALSLVLASVMVLGLMIVGSSAKSDQFSDAEDINEDYLEAIDVLTTIGVLEGTDTSDSPKYEPQGTLTREMAAKILSVMILGKDNADRLGTNAQIFKDVAAGRWSAGYIAYCSETGIIAGDGSGNFDPDGTLTGVAFGKMLLTALGYDAAIEGYINTPSWAINVSSDMVETGVDVDGIKLSDPITREQAAQMALNAIKTPMVHYNGRTEVTVDGTSIVVGGNTAEYVTSTIAKEQYISTRKLTNSNLYTVELGEKYIPNLVLNNDITDEFGRPSSTWAYKTEDIGTYVNDDMLVKPYTSTVKNRDIYNDVGYSVITNYDLYVFVDGANVTNATNITKATLLKTVKEDLDNTGKGVLTEVFVNDEEEEITVSIINTFLAKVTGNYNTSTETLPISVYTDVSNNKVVRLSSNDFDNLAEFSEDDIVKVTMAADNHSSNAAKYTGYTVQSIAVAEKVSDVVISGYSTKASNTIPNWMHLTAVTADGEPYDANVMSYYDPELLQHYNEELDQLKDGKFNLYLDNYGNVLGVQAVSVADNYLFVVGYEPGSTVLAKAIDKALVIHTDGSMETVSIRDDKLEIWNDTDDKWDESPDFLYDEGNVNKWYTYTMDGDTYVLQREVYNQGRTRSFERASNNDADVSGVYADLTTNNPYTDTKNKASNNAKPVPAAYGNAESVYIAVKADDETVGFYDGTIVDVNGVSIGIRNTNIKVQDIRDMNDFWDNYRGKEDLFDTFFIYNNKGYITYAVVIGDDAGNSSNMIFFASGATGRYYDSTVKDYYVTYNAIINGQLTTVKVKDECASKDDPRKYDLWKATIDTNGWIIDLSGSDSTHAYGNTKDNDMNTSENKINKYTQTTGTSLSPVKMQLIGATLWVTTEKTDDNYVVIGDSCKVFVKLYNENNYTEYGSIEEALNSLTNDSKIAYVERVTTIVNGTTGYAETLIITEQKAGSSTSSSGTNATLGDKIPIVNPLGGNNFEVYYYNDGSMDVQDIKEYAMEHMSEYVDLEAKSYAYLGDNTPASMTFEDGSTWGTTANVTMKQVFAIKVNGTIIDYVKATYTGGTLGNSTWTVSDLEKGKYITNGNYRTSPTPDIEVTDSGSTPTTITGINKDLQIFSAYKIELDGVTATIESLAGGTADLTNPTYYIRAGMPIELSAKGTNKFMLFLETDGSGETHELNRYDYYSTDEHMTYDYRVDHDAKIEVIDGYLLRADYNVIRIVDDGDVYFGDELGYSDNSKFANVEDAVSETDGNVFSSSTSIIQNPTYNGYKYTVSSSDDKNGDGIIDLVSVVEIKTTDITVAYGEISIDGTDNKYVQADSTLSLKAKDQDKNINVKIDSDDPEDLEDAGGHYSKDNAGDVFEGTFTIPYHIGTVEFTQGA